jgi:ATP-dependent RNA helicase RhlE
MSLPSVSTVRSHDSSTHPHSAAQPHTATGASRSTTFADLRLAEPLLRALRDEEYPHPTPIQEQAIPPLLEGHDLLGCARTGTGKTAAFVLPILQRLCASNSAAHAGPREARALILVPTRELAAQVHDKIRTYGRHLRPTTAVVYGGVGQGPQVRALARGVDVLVATPGRLLDLFGQRHVRLDRVEILVLDEADQMLDLGFLPAMQRILREVPQKRQTLLFSATMPPAISKLADGILRKPVKVFVTPVASTVETVDQSVHFVDVAGKGALLANLLSEAAVERALVFTRTKRGADRVARGLVQRGIPAQAIHGNKSQGQREHALEGFRRGKTPVLVATDIAARGIDVDGITHVVNYDLPNVPEVYVHRIGRTARAGASGTAIAFCAPAERPLLRDIERLIRKSIPVASGSAHARPRSEHATPGAFGKHAHAGAHGNAHSNSSVDHPAGARAGHREPSHAGSHGHHREHSQGGSRSGHGGPPRKRGGSSHGHRSHHGGPRGSHPGARTTHSQKHPAHHASRPAAPAARFGAGTGLES